MFIDQYKLDRNPFAEDSVRPLFVSQSMREISELIRKVGQGGVQTALITGAAGVGKSTLLSQRIRGFRDVAHSWISPSIDTAERLYQKLLQEIGPGAVAGPPGELSRILEVFLQHQRTNNRLSVVVVDGLERYRPEVLAELRVLLRMHVKRTPLMQFVFLTRNDELVQELLSEHDGAGPAAQARHVHLTGFTLEETHAYLRICLQGAGCEWANELMPESIVLDIQALTQGVVGDINALCCAALEELAQRDPDSSTAPQISNLIIRAAGKKLHMRYEPGKWARKDNEKLSPESVRVNDFSSIRIDSAHLIVSSGGKQLADVSLDRPRMILGRDPGCDISLESTYLSRFQNLFMQTENGWMIVDLNSTNGCFVNGRRVREHRLRDGDFISVGHHQLTFSAQGSGTALERRMPPRSATPGDDTVSTDVSEEREQWTG